MIPLLLSKIQAGFPSPADNYIEKSLSLDEFFIENPAATFFVRVVGASMVEAGIFAGDIAVVNRSLRPQNHDIVVAVVDSDFTLKELIIKNGLWLKPSHPDFPLIALKENKGDYIWGVVSGIVRKYR